MSHEEFIGKIQFKNIHTPEEIRALSAQMYNKTIARRSASIRVTEKEIESIEKKIKWIESLIHTYYNSMFDISNRIKKLEKNNLQNNERVFKNQMEDELRTLTLATVKKEKELEDLKHSLERKKTYLSLLNELFKGEQH